jgi:hypothetical protein
MTGEPPVDLHRRMPIMSLIRALSLVGALAAVLLLVTAQYLSTAPRHDIEPPPITSADDTVRTAADDLAAWPLATTR